MPMKNSTSAVRSKIREMRDASNLFKKWLGEQLQQYGVDKLRLSDINAQNKHIYRKFIDDITDQNTLKIKLKESAFNNNYNLYVHKLKPPITSNVAKDAHLTEVEFNQEIINRKIPQSYVKVVKNLIKTQPVKCWFSVDFTVMLNNKKKPNQIYANQRETEVRTAAIKASIITKTSDLKNFIIDSLMACYLKISEIYSGVVLSCDFIKLSATKFKPRLGGSYVELPKKIQNKRAVVNIKNMKDNLCILYSIASQIRPINDGHPEVLKKYLWVLDVLKYNLSDFENGVAPTSPALLKLEKDNKINLCIYTCDDEGENVQNLRISTQENDVIVNLLLYKGHYTHIKDFQRFMGKGHRTCPRCIKTFHSKNKDAKRHFESHVQNCKSINSTNQLVKMPTIKKTIIKEDLGKDIEVTENPQIRFTGHRKQNRVPVTIYGDFEAINAKVSKQTCDLGNTVKTTQHKPASYRFFIKSTFDLSVYNIPLDYSYVGEDANIHFVKTIMALETKLQDALRKQAWKFKTNMIITDEQTKQFECATDCCFCNKKMSPESKVRDHDHYSGMYRGAACRSCNLAASIFSKTKEGKEFVPQSDIPFYFHNLSYDLRLIINAFTELGGNPYEYYVDKDGNEKKKKVTINCIAENSEKYKCLSLKTFKFIDTMAFQMASLETLYKNVPDHKKCAMKTITNDEELFKLIDGKGQFPYKWFDSMEKLDWKLPRWEAWSNFSNDLTQSNMSYKEYLQFLTVCKKFKIDTFREYHDLYLMRDVYMLADVFECFRDLSMQAYGLDPGHFLGTPGLGWCAMLKKTGVVIEQLTDVDMYMFFEKGIRGGISKAVTRFFEANNEYCNNYDEHKTKSWLAYVDANNLYGKSMVSSLPLSDFKWCDMNIHDVISYAQQWTDDSADGITVEVDFEYPEDLHDLHNEYPLAPVKRSVLEDEISAKSLQDLGDAKFLGSTKLICDLHDKKNYVIHISALKFYLEQGLIITKVHRCIAYTQSKWLKKYIDFNTEMRANSTEKYQKDFYKLMNNAVYGKSMENVRDRTTLRFALTEDDITKWSCKPEFKNVIPGIGNENFRMLNMKTREVCLDKPIFAGQAILDLSKVHMYDFYYNVMKPKYGNNMQLILTDTDSFIFAIKTDNWFTDMGEMSQYFDTANFPKNHELYSKAQENQLGLFKMEEMYMQKVIALKSKIYCYKLADNSEKKTLKGVNRVSKEKDIDWNNYLSCVMDGVSTSVNQNSIRSFKCQNFSITQKKRALSSYDDKRYQVDGINTLAYGHKTLKKNN